jgi:hypothetical protein
MNGDTVWLTRRQMALLFGRDVKAIGKRVGTSIRGELADMATVANFAIVQLEGDRTVEQRVVDYNLDMVLSIGYRVKSPEGIRCRRWATVALTDYLVKGVTVDDRRVEQLGTIVQVLSRSDNEHISGVAHC